MVFPKFNSRAYSSRMYGRGIYGRAYKVKTQYGTGIFDSLGKTASKSIFSGLGKTSGKYGGKQLAKMIEDKTGSKLLGQVSKAALSGIGGLAGAQLGNIVGKTLGDTVFKEDKKKKDEKPKVSLSELLAQARSKISGEQTGNGIAIDY